ncbi:sulfotransferase family protein [Lacinutrix sp. MEBiC02404]
MEKIFCIGFPKTGTTSLEEALSLLGFKVCKGHFNNNHTNYLISLFVNNEFDEIDKIIDYYDAFTDLPFGGTDFYKYLAKKYPTAKFIHTQRDADSWHNSLIKMITKFDSNYSTAMQTFHEKGRYGVIYYLIEVVKVDTLENSKAKILNYYIKINEELNSFFVKNDSAYLSMDLVENEGWEVLCPFLNISIPNRSFPHANKAPSLKKKKTVSNFNRKIFLKIKSLVQK